MQMPVATCPRFLFDFQVKSSETLVCVCLPQVYVHDYNIFLKSDVTAEAVQVTTNGKKNEILNGVPDWVYEGKRVAV